MHWRRQITALGAIAALSAAAAPAAMANDFEEVYDDFKKSGTVHACRFSENELDNAAKQTPPDIEQYVPSFLDALENAREKRDECRGERAPAQEEAAPAPAPAAPPTPGAPSGGAPATPTPGAAAPGSTAPPAPAVPAEPRVSGVPSPPTKATERESGTPAPVWILAALGALAALAALAAAVAWWLGLSPAWAASLRSSFSEAGERFSDFGLEFADWVRTGR